MSDVNDSVDVTLTVKNYRCFPDDEPLRLLLRPGFTSFIGANNSGKSAILRLFYDLRPVFDYIGSDMYPRNAFGEGEFRDCFNGLPGERVCSNLNNRHLDLSLSWTAKRPDSGDLENHVLTANVDRDGRRLSLGLRVGRERIDASSLGFKRDRLVLGDSVIVDLSPVRSLCRSLARGMYIGAFRNTINLGGADNYFDIAVGSRFINQFQEMKAGYRPEQNEAIFDLQRDVQRIFGFESFDINATPDGHNLQLTVDGKSFRPTEVGGGLSHFVIVLANVLSRRPPWIFVDEPEINLHPSLQLDFLMTIGSYAENGVLFATHSLGLARSASDAIYAVRRKGQGRASLKPLDSTPRLAEFVGEMGFRGYRELGFKKLLLVEGPSDLKAIRLLLGKLGRQKDVALIHLGGGSTIHDHSDPELLELTRISDDVHALIDSERSVPDEPLPEDRSGFVTVAESVGIPVHVLKNRALENYFTDRAVKQVLGDGARSLQPFEDVRRAENGWSKKDNWRVAQAMTREEVESSDLGEFLKSL